MSVESVSQCPVECSRVRPLMSTTIHECSGFNKERNFSVMDKDLGICLEESVCKVSEHCCYKSGSDMSSQECVSRTYCRTLFAFWKLLRNVLWNRRTMLVLFIFLNLVLTESSPAHRHPRRHLRHTSRTDRCENPHQHPHLHSQEQECRQSRVRRDLHQLNLREGENATTCDYRVCVDKRANRMPEEIHRVICVETGCLCQEGMFRCTQLTDQVEVWYGLRTTSPRRETVDVEVGCVCAAHHSVPVDILRPSVVNK